MKRLLGWLLALIAVSGSFITGMKAANWSRLNSGHQNAHNAEAIRLAEAALAQASSDPAAAHYLLAAAISQMNGKPEVCAQVWNIVKRLDASARANEANARAEFLYALEQSLKTSRSVSEFRSLYPLLVEVEKTAPSGSQAVFDLLKQINADPDTEKDDAASFDRLARHLGDASLRSMTGDLLEGADRDLKAAVVKMAARVEVCLEHRIAPLKAKLMELRGSLEGNGAAPKDGGIGDCTAIIAAAGEVRQSLDKIGWEYWRSLAEEATPSATQPAETREARNYEAVLSDIEASAVKLRALRYNFWALTRIQQAGQSNLWPDLLGQIDAGLLHSTVATLYQDTYQLHIALVTDPALRVRQVQTILNKQKCSLTDF